MPRLSIVIPTKNEEKHLPRLLVSIQRQKFTDLEVIVADAGSADKTVEIAKKSGARVVKGGLPGVGRNAGAKEAKGDIILFLDADVTLPGAKFLEDLLEEFENKELDIATCKVRPQSRSQVDRALHEAYNAFAVAMEKIRPHAPGFCIFVKRATHEMIHGFDEEVVFAEDHDYVQRAVKAGAKFAVLRSHPIVVSVRRLEKDGRLVLALKYLYTELRTMATGSIKGKIPFSYDMGGEDPTKKDEDV